MIAIPIIVFAIAWIVYDLRRRKHHVEVDGIGSGGRDVVLALGRFEGRQLLRHPAFLTGIGFVALAALILARSGGDATDLSANTNAFGFFAFPLAGMSIIAVSLGVLRARRDGAEELLESMPASEDARAGSHLLTAAWAIAVAAVCMGVLVTASYLGGSYGWPNLPELLVGPVLVGCAVAVAFAAAHPACVSRLVLVAPPAFRDPAMARTRLAQEGWMTRQVTNASPAARLACSLMCLLRPTAMRIAARVALQVPAEIARDGVQHSWPAYRDAVAAMLDANPIVHALEHPSHPTTVVLADIDRRTPKRDVLDHPHDAVQVIVLPGDHLLVYEDGEAIADVIAGTDRLHGEPHGRH